MLKIISLFLALIAIAVITSYLYDFLSPQRLSNSGYITVWVAGEMNESRTIEDPQLISEIQSHWANKKTVEAPKEINYDYLIDGIVEGRLQYASSGYFRILSVVEMPVYKLSDPVSFNDLILSSYE
ncbi:MAG: hypothetical protein R8G33_07550 [Gammaproteobacteria bacterium]|nr:hypothetical protein [Gammaproteobacteria bacterium]